MACLLYSCISSHKTVVTWSLFMLVQLLSDAILVWLHWVTILHYGTLNFIPNPHNRHPIAHPWGWDMGCLLCVWTLIYILLPSHCSATLNIISYWIMNSDHTYGWVIVQEPHNQCISHGVTSILHWHSKYCDISWYLNDHFEQFQLKRCQLSKRFFKPSTAQGN